MILILGTGYMGSDIIKALSEAGHYVRTPGQKLNWNEYTQLQPLQALLQGIHLVVNAAAAIPDGGVSLLNENRTVCLEANAIFPARLAALCADRNIPLIQLSTGCFYDESKEWEEHETPVRDWRDYCGTYLGSKWLAERAVAQWEKHYILRLRLPFDEYDHPRNYLSKLCEFNKWGKVNDGVLAGAGIYRHVNSMTHRGDFAKAVLQFIEKRPTWGTYHVVNTSIQNSPTVAMMLHKERIMTDAPRLVDSKTFGSVLSTKKLRDSGIQMRHVQDALNEAIRLWTPRTKSKS